MQKMLRDALKFVNLFSELQKSRHGLHLLYKRFNINVSVRRKLFTAHGSNYLKKVDITFKKFVTDGHFRLLSCTNVATTKRKSVLFEKGNDELMVHGKEILKDLCTRNDFTAKLHDRFKNELSGILYQYFIRDNQKYLLEMFQLISNKRQCNEACYTVMMRYFAEKEDLDNVKYFFNELEKDTNTTLHGRSFVPLINVCLKRKDYDLARFHFNQLVEHTRKEFKDTSFQDILAECSELVSEMNGKIISAMVYSIFDVLQEFGSGNLHPQTIDAIHQWFQRDPFHTWHINTCDVDKSGTCENCRQKLEPSTMSKERLLRLKRNLMTLIESSIARKVNSRITDVKPLKTNVNIRNKIENQSKYFEFYDIVSMKPSGKSSRDEQPVSRQETSVHKISPEVFGKLKELKEYLDVHGPFDVVIDVLNIGYFTKGFNPLQVRDVLSSFIGKRCLILCAGILKKEILEQVPVAPANRRIQQLLRYMEKNFNLFFVGSSVLDDYYILYSVLHHNFNIELVSRDLFRDHLFHLDSENTSDFQRWQKSNQYILQSFTVDNKPMFEERTTYKVAMQKSDTANWHVPVSDTKWLCIQQS